MDIARCDTILALDMAQRFLIVTHLVDNLYKLKVVERNNGAEYTVLSLFLDPHNSGKCPPVPRFFHPEHMFNSDSYLTNILVLLENQDKSIHRYKINAVPLGQKTKTEILMSDPVDLNTNKN